jgi:integrase
MGQRVTARLPKFVQGFIDRHGRARFYFRRAGFSRTALPGLPWSPDFMAAYETALAGQPAPIGAAKIKAGTIRALAVSYFTSPAFLSMKPTTQRETRGAIERFCREHGDKSAVTLQRQHVIKLMAALAGKPNVANALRARLRALMQHAVEIGLRTEDPTQGVRRIRVRSDGHHSWSEEEIRAFEARWPIGSRERLAFALLLFTGQRRGDVIRLGRQHMRDEILRVRQEKTGADLSIPVHPDLAEILARSAVGNMTFLTTRNGRPFAPAGFSNWFRACCNKAGLPHCSAHGLRKAAARRLAEAGCTAHEISSVTGHASLSEVTRYTRATDQQRLAKAAMDKVKPVPDSVRGALSNLSKGLTIPAKRPAQSK